MLSGDNESKLFYAAVNTQEHDPHERKVEVGKRQRGTAEKGKVARQGEKGVATRDKMESREARRDLVREFRGERGEKKEKARIPFTPLSPANLLRNKLTSVSTESPRLHIVLCLFTDYSYIFIVCSIREVNHVSTVRWSKFKL